jgi:hypothetical protein
MHHGDVRSASLENHSCAVYNSRLPLTRPRMERKKGTCQSCITVCIFRRPPRAESSHYEADHVVDRYVCGAFFSFVPVARQGRGCCPDKPLIAGGCTKGGPPFVPVPCSVLCGAERLPRHAIGDNRMRDVAHNMPFFGRTYVVALIPTGGGRARRHKTAPSEL